MNKSKILFLDDRMCINERCNIYTIFYADIVCITSDSPYLKITGCNGNAQLIFYTLEELMKHLPFGFVLCNRHTIINLFYITAFQKEKKDCFLQLKNGAKETISRRRKNEVYEKFERTIFEK